MRGFGQTSIFMFLYLYSRFILQSVLALGFLVSGLEVCFFRIFNLITTIFSIFCVDRARSNRSGARFSSSFFFFLLYGQALSLMQLELIKSGRCMHVRDRRAIPRLLRNTSALD